MSTLQWNQAGKRLYETGVSHGVLYLPNGKAVPWNGLVSVEESATEEAEAFYIDGIKFIDIPAVEEYVASLKALTYPDEFLPFDGIGDLGHGIYADDQPQKRFSLAYRTLVGNDILGTKYGYKIHLVYNLTAIPEDKSQTTLSDQAQGSEFGWEISAVPERVSGYKPTAHVVIDSTRINPYLLKELETILFGMPDMFDGGTPWSSEPWEPIEGIDGGTPDETSPGVFDVETTEFADGRLPSLQELVEIVGMWTLITIRTNSAGIWFATGPSELVRMLDSETFVIEDANVEYGPNGEYTISDTIE